MIPLQSAAGENEEDPRRAVFADPILGLLGNPGRGGCFRRSKQNEKQRLIDRLTNTRPKSRIYREVGLIAKNMQSSQPIPGFGKRMQSRLEGSSEGNIGCVTVRDEGVVGHHLFEDTPDGAGVAENAGRGLYAI
jgi:hypothetical protein